MRTLDLVLRDVPLFEGLTDEQRLLLVGCAGNASFREGRVIVREGDPANTFFLIRHGSIAIETFVPARGPITIETIEPGEIVGWSWLFAPYRWHFDARALSTVRAPAFDGACLRGKCDEDAELGYELMSRFAQVLMERLQWTRLRL